mmetsp:Transcript_8257/g.17218  ORF Transcript_8257/g.17218 Transcript_8257/m.17218 type:complete len:316 (-) Transcript_8257:38-985(-)
MHDILPKGCLSFDHEISFPIKSFEFINGSVLPWFIDRFQSEHRRMTSISIDNFLNDGERMLDVLSIDVGVLRLVLIKGSHPLGISNGPMLKRDLVYVFRTEGTGPLESERLSGIVKSVLRVFHGVNVKEHGQSVGVGPVQEVVHVLQCPIKASHVRTVGLVHVISHGQSQGVDRSAVGQFRNNVLGDPLVPVIAQLSIGLGGAQDLTKGVRIKGRGVLAATQKLVKQGRGDPRLQHHPASQIHSADLIVEGTRVLVGTAGHGLVVGHKVAKGSRIIIQRRVIRSYSYSCTNCQQHNQKYPTQETHHRGRYVRLVG